MLPKAVPLIPEDFSQHIDKACQHLHVLIDAISYNENANRVVLYNEIYRVVISPLLCVEIIFNLFVSIKSL